MCVCVCVYVCGCVCGCVMYGGAGGFLRCWHTHLLVYVRMDGCEWLTPAPFPSPQSLFEQQMRGIGHRRPPAAAAAAAAPAPEATTAAAAAGAVTAAPEAATAAAVAAAAAGVGGGAQDMSSSITVGEEVVERAHEAADANGLLALPQDP